MRKAGDDLSGPRRNAEQEKDTDTALWKQWKMKCERKRENFYLYAIKCNGKATGAKGNERQHYK